MALAERSGDKEGEAGSYHNLAHCSRACGELREAETMMRRSLDIYSSINESSQEVAECYADLGLIEWTKHNYDAALHYVRKALDIFDDLGCPDGVALTCGHLGLICHSRGELDEAEQHFLNSLSMEKDLERSEGVARAYAGLGLLYLTQGNLDRAVDLLQGPRYKHGHRQKRRHCERHSDLGTITGCAENSIKPRQCFANRCELTRSWVGRKLSLVSMAVLAKSARPVEITTVP